MQTRIDRLEGLVLSLMTNGSQSSGPSSASDALARISSSNDGDMGLDDDDGCAREQEGNGSEIGEVANSIGVMKIDNDKSTFASEVHWYAILSEVYPDATS